MRRALKPLSRRAFLQSAVAIPVCAMGADELTPSDHAFLEDLSRRAFLYFWEQADGSTGLVLDRARSDGNQRKGRSHNVASMAATGFGLTALCIAFERRWKNPNEVRERVRTTLRHFAYEQAQRFGWFYHFVDRGTGDRVWNCELSSIDTALLLAGVLTAQECFGSDPEIPRLAQTIYERVNFQWMLDPVTQCLRMGWKPEAGFLRSAWVAYRENMILNLLALGSPTHPLPASTWYRFRRDPIAFENYEYIGRGGIFTHQFPQAWLLLKNLRDGPPYEIDYFHNSAIATRAHRAFCLSLRSMYPSFSENLWGVTASDSNIGYVTWGRSMLRRYFDGTIVPCAAGGSLMFTPDICLPALRFMHDNFGGLIYGRYGFADAFHPQTRWVSPDVLGIDLGITLVSAENLRSGRVWNWFMQADAVEQAMSQVFRPMPIS